MNIPVGPFLNLDKLILKFMWKHKELQQIGFIEKKKFGRLTILQCKIIMKSSSFTSRVGVDNRQTDRWNTVNKWTNIYPHDWFMTKVEKSR